MSYTIHEIARILGSKVEGNQDSNTIIEHLLYDSRKLIFPSNTIFFAIPGDQHNGHDFIDELYSNKLCQFIVSEDIDISAYSRASFIKVKDTILALQILSKYHREQKSLNVVGITGSNGKTITKEWLFQLCNPEFHIVKSPRSFNSQIGVPFSVWQIQDEHDLGIFEAGISRAGEMEILAPIIQPNIGILTHLGDAHDIGFKSKSQKIADKIKLFKNAETIIFTSDDPDVDAAIRTTYQNKQLLNWTFRNDIDAYLKILNLESDSGGCSLDLKLDGDAKTVELPFNDKASIENVLSCIVFMYYLNYDWQTIIQRISHLEPIRMRLEMKEGINNCQLVNDSYNSDLSSLKTALDFANNQKHGQDFILVVSDIFQSRITANDLYRHISEMIKSYPVKHIYAVGENILLLKDSFKNSEITFFSNSEDLREHFSTIAFNDEMILFKGARKYSFESVFSDLSRQIHNTILEVDLNGIAQNIRFYASHLKPETKIMAMVKASAYGSGSVELARFLESRMIPYLAVAYADEGVQLRKSGIQIPIVVMNSENASFRKILEYDLEPAIYHNQQINTLQNLVSGQPKKIHIKIDSGMNRLGFRNEQITKLLEILDQTKIEISSVFTHLAASEDASEDDFSIKQIQYFESACNRLIQNLKNKPFRHVLNSSGIIRFPEYQYEMVRLGLGMYGIDSSSTISKQLIKVHQLKARISQIKLIQADDTVGYNRRFKSTTEKRIATLSIGYADGLLRKAGNERYSVMIRNQSAPIVGNICMDMCMVDINHIPLAKEGDEAIIFGLSPDIEELALVCDTIPYEILTRISDRVKRLYFEN